MQFDWYQATLPALPEVVIGAMEKAYPHTDLAPATPSNGYTKGAQLVLGDAKVLTLMWGGVNGEDATHVKATGRDSIKFSEFAREHFAGHQVSRLDVAIDYEEEGSFDKLAKMLINYAKSSTLKTSTAGDWVKHIGGKTLYLGSRSSPTYLRLYEKGKEQASKGFDTVNPHWTRCELEVKPGKKEGKAWLATATPEQCWAASRWSLKVAELLGTSGLVRPAVGTIKAVSDDEAKMHYLMQQWGPFLRKMYGVSGEDKEAFATLLLSRMYPDEYGVVNGRMERTNRPNEAPDLEQLRKAFDAADGRREGSAQAAS